VFSLLLLFGVCSTDRDDHSGTAEKRPMQIELNVFSGRPNPTWSLNDQQADQFRAKFNVIRKSDCGHEPYDGLGYRGFKVEGFQDYDELIVCADTVEARRGRSRYWWLDESRSLERYLLESSKGHIDEGLYQAIASAVEKY
jgi:hypothetical protein